MMKACGIIAEWNPFHKGHAYLLEQVRQRTGADILIAAMSGNYTQRGEPAITSKWLRAETGLHNGIDIVVELPFWFATQPADIFAQGGVSLLHAMQCESIAFGVDTDNFTDYKRLAQWLVTHPEAVKLVTEQVKSSQASFAELQLDIIRHLQRQVPALADLQVNFDKNSNTLLGYTYAKAIYQMNIDLEMVTVKRIGAKHDEKGMVETDGFVSGSFIRQQLIGCHQENQGTFLIREKLQQMMPPDLADKLLAQANLPSLENLYPIVRYLLISQSAEQLAQIYQIHEGIEQRLINLALKIADYAAFIQAAKHRSWPEPRIRRALLMIAMQVLDRDMQMTINGKQPIFLLGATEKGRQYLKKLDIDANNNWHFVSRANKEIAKNWPMWFKVDKIYQEYLIKTTQDENFGHPPIFV